MERQSFVTLLDWGASDHAVNDIIGMRNAQKIKPRSIIIGDGRSMVTETMSDVTLQVVIRAGGWDPFVTDYV